MRKAHGWQPSGSFKRQLLIDVTTNKRFNLGALDLGVTSFGPRHAPVRSGLTSLCICLGNLRRHSMYLPG